MFRLRIRSRALTIARYIYIYLLLHVGIVSSTIGFARCARSDYQSALIESQYHVIFA